MSFQQTFAPEEWSVILGAPHMVGTAVMMASFSGLSGTAKEAFSMASSLAEGRAGSNPSIPYRDKRDGAVCRGSVAKHAPFRAQASRESVGRCAP